MLAKLVSGALSSVIGALLFWLFTIGEATTREVVIIGIALFVGCLPLLSEEVSHAD